MKQSSLDEQEQMNLEMETPPAENEEDLSDYYRQYEDSNLNATSEGEIYRDRAK